jgi:SAM-dependent methyltransferase
MTFAQESESMSTRYDEIGKSYCATRRPDPRIATAILRALGDARSVANIGAGAGSYEPADRDVLAVEPSETMIAQRLPGSAPAVRARAENLPLRNGSFDAALAVNTVHHWADLRAGLRELRRIARERIVIFLRNARSGTPFWLTEDYLPGLDPSRRHTAIVDLISSELRPTAALPVRMPCDCIDGLFSAYWGRPEMYLNTEVRRNISNFALVAERDVADGLARLQADIESGVWDRKYGHLRRLPELDLGHRLLVVELA